MVASSLLVLTTGRQYCERFAARLPLKILDCPVALPRLMYYQLWHERTHSSSSARWLRDCIKGVAASLRPPGAALHTPGAALHTPGAAPSTMPAPVHPPAAEPDTSDP
jgi:hypothetical protein